MDTRVQKMKSKKSKQEELTSRKWGICSTDEKTLTKVFELFSTLGLTGPIHIFPFLHSLYMYRARPRYNVPYAVVDHLLKHRESEGYDFYAFSQISRQTWALYREGTNKHSEAMTKVFDGSSVARNARLGLVSQQELVPNYKQRR